MKKRARQGIAVVLFVAGVCLFVASFVLLGPEFVARHFSPDGILSPDTVGMVLATRYGGMACGALLGAAGILVLFYPRVSKVLFAQLNRLSGALRPLGRSAAATWVTRHKRGLLLVILLLIAEGLAVHSALPLIQSSYVIQNDVRHTAFWMYQYQDPDLFPNDYIVNTKRGGSLSLGHNFVFWVFSHWMDPILFSEILVLLIAPLTAYLLFRLGERLRGVTTGFLLAGLFLATHFSWIAEGLPRSFALPVLAGFALALAARRWIVAGVVLVVSVTIVPHVAVLCGAIWLLQTIRFRNPLRVRLERRSFVALIAATALCGLFLILTRPDVGRGTLSTFYSIANYSAVRNNPQFNPGGRHAMFSDSRLFGVIPLHFVNTSYIGLTLIGYPVKRMFLGFLAIAGAALCFRRLRSVPKLAWSVLLGGLGTYLVALTVMLALYMPGKYMRYSLSLFLLLFVSWTFSVCAARAAEWLRRRGGVARGVTVLILCLAVLVPTFLLGAVNKTLRVSGVVDQRDYRAVYESIATLPKDVLIAGPPSLEVLNNIPVFSKRSVFLNGEFLDLTEEAKRRGMAIFDAYYTDSPDALAAFIREEGITHLFVVPALFDRELLKEGYYYHPYRERIVAITAGREEFVLEKVPEDFAVLMTYDAFLVDCGPPFLRWLESKEGSG